MHIAIVGPSPVPFAIGGVEGLLAGLRDHIERLTDHHVELVKLPSRERSFWELIDTYRQFWSLDLAHFDLVISTKYPAWMVRHPHHVCYMQHRLRGLYDTYHLSGAPIDVPRGARAVDAMIEYMDAHAESSDPAVVTEFFAQLDTLHAKHADLAPHYWAFPGPFIRRIVHFLDGLALSRSRIRRFCAISRTVADRHEYFPRGVPVDVIHHPSRLTGFQNTSADYLFTTSRLDGPKRVQLLVDAMKMTRCPLPLRIAGTGPEEAALRNRAADDPRIEFLGFVSDTALSALYGGALGVLFVPYEEDYGLVTIESMMSEKPVITCTDSGGPLEFVEDGVTGHVAAPEADAIAARIDALVADRDGAARMGRAGHERVRNVTWERTVEHLLRGRLGRARSWRRARAARPKITVAVPFPVSPARGGGQVRVLSLYTELARRFDVEVVTVGEPNSRAGEIPLAPGLTEIRVPKTAAHIGAEAELAASVHGLPIGDIALTLFHELTPEFAAALSRSMADAAVVVASHPFALPALLPARDRQPLIYEAHNLEYALKAEMLAPVHDVAPLLDKVAGVEADACRLSSLVLCCAREDAAELVARYGVDGARIVYAPNGVDVTRVRFTAPEDREGCKRDFGLAGQRVALFIGSWHPPNLAAADVVFRIAPSLPDVTFLLVGSQCLPLAERSRPTNVGLVGAVDDPMLATLLSLADIGLNPMVGGSGSNLKMALYLAAGLPTVSSPKGCRGYDVVPGTHVCVASVEEFAAGVRALVADPRGAAKLAWEGRRLVEDRYDWKRIAADVGAAIGELIGMRRQPPAGPVERLVNTVSRRMAEIGVPEHDAVVASVVTVVTDVVSADGPSDVPGLRFDAGGVPDGASARVMADPDGRAVVEEPVRARDPWTPPPATEAFVSGFVTEHESLPAGHYVRQVYRTVLGREPDPGGMAHYVAALDGARDRRGIVLDLLHSAELAHRTRATRPSVGRPTRLNLGCGFDKREGYLNVDFQSFHEPDLVADIRRLDMLPSQSFEEILAQDCLEHFPRGDTKSALREWHRLLKRGGVLRLRVPNLVGLLDLLRAPANQSVETQERLVQCAYGTQAYEGDFHHTAFTRVLLEAYLREAGFEKIRFTVKDDWLFDVEAVRA